MPSARIRADLHPGKKKEELVNVGSDLNHNICQCKFLSNEPADFLFVEHALRILIQLRKPPPALCFCFHKFAEPSEPVVVSSFLGCCLLEEFDYFSVLVPSQHDVGGAAGIPFSVRVVIGMVDFVGVLPSRFAHFLEYLFQRFTLILQMLGCGDLYEGSLRRNEHIWAAWELLHLRLFFTF